MATAVFMSSSFIIVLSQTFCGECLADLLSRAPEEYRKSEEAMLAAQSEVGMGSDNFGSGAGSEYDSGSDDEYVVIPQEYQAQGTVVSRNIGAYGDD